MAKSSNASKNEVFLTQKGDVKGRGDYRIPVICGIFIVLMCMGLANLYSASLGEVYFYSQMKRMAVGLFLVGVFGWFVPIRHVNTYSYWFFALVCFLLMVVVILGHAAGGSQRWIHLGVFAIQPSEFAKIAIILVVAKFFYMNRQTSYFIRDLWFLLLLVGITFALIFDQPDLGTAGVCLLIATAQIAFVRINLRSIGIVALSSLMVAGLGWNLFLRDYQKLRIINLFNPNFDPHGSGYNSIQSLVAIGSGRLFGKGFAQGTQAQLQFLPARHTDFIFSVFAEEHGFWSGALVFILFALMTYLILEIARHSSDIFCSLVAIGIGALFFIEFAINVAMVLGMFPVVGIPLPLFSYGGSSLVSICIALGLLIAIDRHTKASKKAVQVR